MKWYYNGEVYDPAYEDIPEDVLGFVYIITDTESGEKYIGQKRMRKPKTLPITKSRKRRVRTVVESDWRSYHSSSAVIKENVAAGHTARYHREIIRFGGSKGDLHLLELIEQIERNVLFDPTYLNGLVNVRIHKKHISKKLRREFGYDN
jgi:hypothetical protein